MQSHSRICIIDDDAICVFGIKRALASINFTPEISVFENGLDALENFKKLLLEDAVLPSILFLDLNMPIMDGWEFLEDFVKLPNHNLDKVIIYIISSSVDPKDLRRVKDFDVVDNYILKPIAPKDLESVLQNFS